MHLDLPYLALCMLFNLIPVPPYARKANATPSMQPPHTHLPTYLPTYTPPFFLSSYQIPRYTSSNHPNSLPTPSHRKACIPGADFSPFRKQAHSFALPPLSLGAIRSPSHLITSPLHEASHTTPHHLSGRKQSKHRPGTKRSGARRSFMHAMQVSCA